MPSLTASRVLSGAWQGCLAWAAMAAAENLVLITIPWAIQPPDVFSGVNFYFTLILALAFCFCGAVIGVAIALALARLEGWQVQTLAVIVYLVLNIAVSPRSSNPFTAILATPILSALLLCAALLSLCFPSYLRLLGRPWLIGALLYGSSSIVWDYLRGGPRWRTLIFAAGFAALACIAALLISRLRWPLGRAVAATFGMLALTVASSGLEKKKVVLQTIKQGTPPAGKPNVILIVLDTVRADHLSVYGYERDTTPNLRDLTRDSVLYRNAFSSGNMTLATHGSLFTGLYPVVHGAHYRKGFPDIGAPLADSHTTLSEILAAQGYNTAAIAANSGYLTRDFGFAQGFAYYDARPADPFLDRGSYFGGGLPRYSLRWKIRRLITNRLKPRQYEQISRRAEEINREAYRRLEVLRQDQRPFFLFLNYMDAHTPYIPPRPFDTKYPGVDDGITTPYVLDITQHLLKYGGNIPMRLQRHIHSQYDGGIAYIDYEIGKFISHLKSVNLYDNSMIIITADHGEALGEHNMLDHGTSVYNEQVKIPLIIRYPRNKATATRGQVRNEATSSVDILPTVLDTIGLPVPAKLNGVSLLNKPNPERPVFSESYRRGPQGSDPARNAQRAVVFRDWKLVADPSGRCELYSLRSDTNEATNLCEQEQELSKNLIGMLSNLTRPANSPMEKPLQLDKQTLDRLRSLGYIQ